MEIIFNGKKFNTSSKDINEFLSTHLDCNLDSKNFVFILNGYAINENLELKENDLFFCIPKNELPNRELLEAMMSARHTPFVFERLKKASVAICGLGGLGSNIALSLARSGVGHLRLIDFDTIEPSNLNRQAYEIADLGKKKTNALKEQIARINPFIEVSVHDLKLDSNNIDSIFKGDDIVCEAFDKAESKAMLAQNLHKFYPHIILISASGLAGFGESNLIQTKKINDKFYICGDLINGAKIGRGLMAPRVAICAAHQANLVLELLCKD